MNEVVALENRPDVAPAAPSWSTACPDWEERIVNRRSLVPFAPLFPAQAEAALEIYRDLYLVDVAGRPTMAEANLDWAFDLPRALFGSYDAQTGERLIRYYFELIAKKNAKSTRAGGIMLTALMRNWRESGEFYILAPTKEIADNSFIPARDMIATDEKLRPLLHVQENKRIITHRNTGAFLKIVAADTDAVGGKKTIGLLIDELWLFGKRADAESMIREAQGGLASRPEGFVIYLSTQPPETPAGVFANKLAEFRDIRDGKLHDPASLPILYEFPKRMVESGEYKKPSNFYIPNPNLDKSVSLQYLVEQQVKAERAGVGPTKDFEAKHLNIEIDVAAGVSPWRGATYWSKQADPTLTLESLLKRCEVVTVGGDGGGLDDLLAIAVIGRERVTRHWLCWAHAWADPNVLEVHKEIAPRLRDFEQEGSLTICQVPEDIAGLRATFEQVMASGLLPEKDAVGLDPNNVAAMIEELTGGGMTDDMLRRLLQGPALSPAWWGIERKLKDGTFWHCGSKMLAWVVGNARAENKGNAIMITKQVAGRAKIDPLIAIGEASVLMSWNPEAAKPVRPQLIIV